MGYGLRTKLGLSPLEKNIKKRKSSLAGFTLIEIMLSIAILSLGLILILQGFTHSLNILRISQNNLAASLLAEIKMAQMQITALQDKNALLRSLGEKLPYDNIEFNWAVKIIPDEEYEDLNKVWTTLSWREGKRKGATPLITYLRTPPLADSP